MTNERSTGTSSKLATLLKMMGLVKPLSGFMALAVVSGTLAYLAVQFIPVLGGYAILDGLGLDVPIPSATIWIILPLLALLRAVLRFTEQRLNHFIAFKLLALVRDRVFGALRRLCPARLEGRDKGELVSLITADVELLEVFYAHTISPICIAFIVEAVMCVYIGSFHIGLGILALAAYLCVGIAVPLIISSISGNMGEKVRQQSAELASCVLENIRGLDETIQYGSSKERMIAMRKKTKALQWHQSSLNRLTGLNLAIANSFILVFDILMAVTAGLLYLHGKVGFDGFLLPVLAMLSSFGPVSALASLGTTLQNTTASGARILAIIEEEPETEEITGHEEVEFRGAECKMVFSLSIPENQIIGIVGESGCGKSTLLKLLMRFWEVQKGRIAIMGQDPDDPDSAKASTYGPGKAVPVNINEINTSNLRDMESYMTQETQVFKDTIAGNIRVAKLDATQEEIEEACRKASLHDWIMTLPDGYESETENRPGKGILTWRSVPSSRRAYQQP